MLWTEYWAQWNLSVDSWISFFFHSNFSWPILIWCRLANVSRYICVNWFTEKEIIAGGKIPSKF